MKVLAIGEVMMRLTPPSYKMIEQTDTLDLSFSGTGLNILSGLARNNIEVGILTGLPDNAVGKAAGSFIRKLGVRDQWVNYQGNHIGTYFLELGYGMRASQVTYLNRSESSFCSQPITEERLEEGIKDSQMIHICGIALSTSSISRDLVLRAVAIAHRLGKKVIFDFNYRPSLNQETNQKQLIHDYHTILKQADIVFGSSRDISNLFELVDQSEEELLKRFFEAFPNVAWFSGTKRSESKGNISGFIVTRELKVVSSGSSLTIYDRIGTGDAYAVGVLMGYIHNWSLEETVAFATASAELAHTTFGDSPVLDEVFIRRYMADPHNKVYR